MEVVFVIVWIVCAFAAGTIAGEKGHGGCFWSFLGLLLGPLALLVAASLSPAPKEADPAPAMKKCPLCAEPIRAEAVKCRYCGADIQTP